MRYGLQTLSIQPWNRYGLPTGERLLSQALKQAGYRTAFIGEWRLGHARPDFWPTRRGFDHFYGSLTNLRDRHTKRNAAGESDWRRGEQSLKEKGYATALLAREAAGLIQRHDAAVPLFLYLALPAPAAPFDVPKEAAMQCTELPEENRRAYCASLHMLDGALGAMVSALQKKQMWSNTVLVFHSDNGGAVRTKFATGDGDVVRQAADNGPFRDGRGSMYEGAVRVAAFVTAPGRLQPGVSSDLIHVTDLYPTLLALAHGKADAESQVKPLDGLDMWNTLAEGKPSPRREVLLNVEEFRGALIAGSWKLLVYAPLPARYELYNVAEDPSEEDNRADRERQKVQELLSTLNQFAWEMIPSLYLSELAGARKHDMPVYWGENPPRP
jgi:arylsulfatase A-like enzyme